METVKNTARTDNRDYRCDENSIYLSVERLLCAICGKSLDIRNAYSDTYYQPLCLDCLMELHRIL